MTSFWAMWTSANRVSRDNVGTADWLIAFDGNNWSTREYYETARNHAVKRPSHFRQYIIIIIIIIIIRGFNQTIHYQLKVAVRTWIMKQHETVLESAPPTSGNM